MLSYAAACELGATEAKQQVVLGDGAQWIKTQAQEHFPEAVKILVAAPRYGFELPPSPGGAQFVQAYSDAVNRVLTGQQTPKQALDQAQKEAQAAIDANKK